MFRTGVARDLRVLDPRGRRRVLAGRRGAAAVDRRPTTRPSSRSPAARSVARSPIATTSWLARSERDANGEALREYRDDALSHVLGYASRQYGTTGLERAYNAELIGLSSDRASAGCSASSARRPTSRWGSR